MKTTLTITIPRWMVRALLPAVLFYRRLRFGKPFRRIPLTRGQFALVDPHDYPALAKYNWRLCPAPNTNYAARSIKKPGSNKYSRLLMHRQLITPPPGCVIDHINRDGLDNTRSNLRLATISQNAANATKRKTNKAGYKGVWFAKDKNKYRAAIWHKNKRHYLGYHNTPEDAAKAYDVAAKRLHCEFAHLNFPNSKQKPQAQAPDYPQ